MALTILLFWWMFYAGLIGWYQHKTSVIGLESGIDRKKYIVPRVLLAHMLGCYFLTVFLSAFSSLDQVPEALFFAILGILLSAEYFWLRLSGVKLTIYRSISFQLTVLFIGVVVAYRAAAESWIYLEKMTQVSAGIFIPFYLLLILLLVLIVWALAVQFMLITFSCAQIWRRKQNGDKHPERMLVVIVAAVTSFAVMVAFLDILDDRFIPLMSEHYFVDWMYHDNSNLLNQVICTNLPVEVKMVLLPTGEVSIAERGAEGWLFRVEGCSKD